ncbi:Rad51-domain-containing protein [Phlyctochytrium arcticum]|nr:Rad51-domain-containing protein [Phlyctochytrium arcticum]
MDLAQLNLHPNVHKQLQTAGYTCVSNVLTLSANDLAAKVKITLDEAENTLKKCCQHVFSLEKHQTTALLQKQKHRKLTLGDETLDATLRGGIATGLLTEVYGKSASGKTQMMLQLCLATQLPLELGGLNSVIYVATEQTFPIKRFAQMEENFKRKYPVMSNVDMGSNVHIVHVRDYITQEHILNYHLFTPLKAHNVKLIIIDSITANFRGNEDGTLNMSTRTNSICGIGYSLKRIAAEYDAAVVCVNQVTDAFGTARREKSTSEDETVPSLGLAWANSINVRIRLQRQEEYRKEEDLPAGAVLEPKQPTRILGISFGPDTPNSECHYEITERGMVGIPTKAANDP